MKDQIKIEDYKFTGIGQIAWGYVTVFGKSINFDYSKYDAITVAIELGFMEEPSDRDKTRVGYEKTAFSATVREVWPWEQRIKYEENDTYLCEFGGTDFGEQIVLQLAVQSNEVRQVIQAEATSIACCDCPPHIVGAIGIEAWMEENKYFFWVNGTNLVDWEAVSQHKIASLRTENKLVKKLL
jgi:hypothetical protein